MFGPLCTGFSLHCFFFHPHINCHLPFIHTDIIDGEGHQLSVRARTKMQEGRNRMGRLLNPALSLVS